MSKTPANPFLETDFSKFMDVSKYMDMSKMMDISKMMDMSRMMGDGKVPSMDMDAMMATQRKNAEMMAIAHQKTFESVQSFMRRQTELARESFEAATKLMQDVMSAPTPEEKVAKQIQATKSTIEGCVSSLKELSDMLSQSQMQTVQAMSSRMVETMDEMQNFVKKDEAAK